MVSALTKKPVKVTMTGPHMLAKVAYDEHYNDIAAMMADLGKLLRSGGSSDALSFGAAWSPFWCSASPFTTPLGSRVKLMLIPATLAKNRVLTGEDDLDRKSQSASPTPTFEGALFDDFAQTLWAR
jgi:hypothetical protein